MAPRSTATSGTSQHIPGTGPDMNDPRYKEHMDKVRISEQAKAEAAFARTRANFISAVEAAAGKNPQIPTEVFAAISDEYNRLHPALIKEMREAYKVSPNPSILKTNINTIQNKYTVLLHDKIVQTQGEPGNEALSAVAQQMRGDSVFTGPIKTFYNSDNGGVQWGGLAGGLIAAVGTYFATAQAGTLVNVLATVAMGAVGAYAVHKMVDGKPEPVANPDFHSRYKTPQKGHGKQLLREGTTQPPLENTISEPEKLDYAQILKDSENKVTVKTEAPDVRKMGIIDENLVNRATGQSPT